MVRKESVMETSSSDAAMMKGGGSGGGGNSKLLPRSVSTSMKQYQALKEEGKIAFQQQNYVLAIEKYDAAITECDTCFEECDYLFEVATCLSNKGLCKMKMCQYELAINDCRHSYSYSPSTKALYTIAKCLDALGEHEGSYEICQLILMIDNVAAVANYAADLKKRLTKQQNEPTVARSRQTIEATFQGPMDKTKFPFGNPPVLHPAVRASIDYIVDKYISPSEDDSYKHTDIKIPVMQFRNIGALMSEHVRKLTYINQTLKNQQKNLSSLSSSYVLQSLCEELFVLLSSEWWRTWMKYSSFCSTIHTTQFDSSQIPTSPGTINNLGLVKISSTDINVDGRKRSLSPAQTSNLDEALVDVDLYDRLHPGLVGSWANLDMNERMGDFVVIPCEVWKTLKDWYGGGPAVFVKLSLESFQEDVINVHFRSEQLEVVCDKQAIQSYFENILQSEIKLNKISLQSPNKLGNVEKFHCHVCRTTESLKRCQCRQVHYCGSQCQLADWKFHKNFCNTNRTIPKQCRGRAGLANLGNSCYLNSSLQCLSHMFPLTKYFLTGAYEAHINATSRDGTGGRLAREYTNLLKELWLRPYPSPMIQPVDIKRLLGKINEDYAGVQQQDAHDVLEMLLDRLHEDVNLIATKPYVENVEAKEGEDSVAVGNEAWRRHELRHNSFVKDLVGGQLRSQLVCPHPRCSRISITFDYHSTIMLAIPPDKIKDAELRKKGRTRTISEGAYGMMGTTYSPIVTIPITFIPEVPVKYDASPVSGSGNLQAKAESTGRPVEISIEIDRRLPVADLKLAVYRKLNEKSAEENSDNESSYLIAFVEQFQNKFGRDDWIFSKMLQDTDLCGTIYTDLNNNQNHIKVVTYSFKEKNKQKAWIYQKGCVTENEGVLLGMPILIAYDANWSCARLRVSIWRQVSRVLRLNQDGSSQQHPRDVKTDLLWASKIKVFVCDRYVNHVSPILLGSKVESCVVPTSKEITVEDFLGSYDPDTLNFCIEWDHEWIPLVDAKEAEAVTTLFSPPLPAVAPNKTSRQVLEDVVTLEDCLSLFTQEEQLDEANSWYCNLCKEHRQAMKTLQFWRLPDILIIGLKRFESINGTFALPSYLGAGGYGGGSTFTGNFREKITTFVDFPIDGLDMSPYCADHAISVNQCGSAKAGKEGSTKSPFIYDLFAVINHYGKMGFGHYTAIVRDWDAQAAYNDEFERKKSSDNWYSYDDESVQSIQESYVKSSAAYILFYRRRYMKHT